MNLKNNYFEFENEINNRGIECLVHFTPTLNLLSILEQNKLLSRSVLESLDIKQYDIMDYVSEWTNPNPDCAEIEIYLFGASTSYLYIDFIVKNRPTNY